MLTRHPLSYLALGTVTILALTACGQGTPEAAPATVTVTAEPSSSPTQTETSTPTASPETTSASATSASASSSSTATGSTSASSQSASEKDYGEGEINNRGNLVKDLGDWAGMTENGGTLLDFRINSITADPTCTGDPAAESENGHFIVLDVEVETFDGVREATYESGFTMLPMEFKTIGTDGRTSNADPGTLGAFACFPDPQLLPGELGDNEVAEGKIVLDVEDPSGTLVYENMFIDTGGAWEWAY